MKVYEGVEVQLHSFLNSALDGMISHLHALTTLQSAKGPAVPNE